MKTDACVSVIVPVYNMEKLIRRCIESILGQTYANLQLVLVDDGSRDQSPAICDEYAAQDDRVLSLHKDNSGVADATNVGLDHATGDFILFVDSDDYIDPNMIERLVAAWEETDADIVQTGMSRVNESDAVTETNEQSPAFFADTDVVLTEFFCGTRIMMCLAGKLFKKRLFETYRFESGRQIIDILATPFLLHACSTYQIISGAPYKAYFRSDSVSRGTMTDRSYDDTFYYLEAWDRFLSDFYSDRADFRARLLYRSCFEMSTRFALVKKSPSVTDKKAKLRAMRARFKADYTVLKRSPFYADYPKKRRLMFTLFSVSPWLMNAASRLHSKL